MNQLVTKSHTNTESKGTLHLDKQLRARRTASFGLAIIGIINIISALTPPLRARRMFIHNIAPVFFPHAAAATTLALSIALLFIIKGLRLGQYNAWILSVVAMLAIMVFNLIKGLDYEETIITGIVTAYLLLNMRYFKAATHKPSLKKALLAISFAALFLFSLSIFIIIYDKIKHRNLNHYFKHNKGASSGIFEYRIPTLHGDLGHLLTISIPTIGASIIALLAWLIFRPQVHHILFDDDDSTENRDRVRRLIEIYGSDTLTYFALRDDKTYFFAGESCIAYSVLNGVALVSPDPIGPVSERTIIWELFRIMTNEKGWTIAIIGASVQWRDIYKASGFRSIYMGDEAIVDVTQFEFAGKKNKNLRQARNRVLNHGYTIEFFDPSEMDVDLVAFLKSIMADTRRGDDERGFSMTLGRAFSNEDKGLLCAVAFDHSHTPVGFCIYVPATNINGYSLDIMRRANGEHVNGLMDFIIIETILEIRERGYSHLALNFATKRAVLAGEHGTKLKTRAESWFLKKFGKDMQIESLWYFNSKYYPEWIPRYALFNTPEYFLPSAFAMAKAESISEIPVIGKLFEVKKKNEKP